MIDIFLSHIQCDEETNEVGNDDPYVLVTAVALTPSAAGLPVQAPVASDVVVYPFANMQTGGRPRFGRFESFWGVGGQPAPLTTPDDAIFVVAMNECDDGDPFRARGVVDTAVTASLATSLALPRPGKVTTLLRDVDSARRIPTGFPNFDDAIGPPLELAFSADELRRAAGGETVTKTLVFAGDGGRYTLRFDAVGAAAPEEDGVSFEQVVVPVTGLSYAVEEAGLDPITGRATGGRLLWHRHRGWRLGAAAWAGPGAQGRGWNRFKQVFSGGDGVVYAVEESGFDPTTGRRTGGDLLWYRHDGRRDGAFAWAARSGSPVGREWNFRHVFSGGQGVIYAVRHDGALLWHRHDGRSDGRFAWAEGSGRVVAQDGWGSFQHVFSGGDGVIYAVEALGFDPVTGRRTGGRLLWWRHEGWRDGGPAWQGPRTVGTRWDPFRLVFAGDGGAIYAIRDDGALLWFRHDGQDDGTFTWAERSGIAVGSGWNFKHVFAG